MSNGYDDGAARWSWALRWPAITGRGRATLLWSLLLGGAAAAQISGGPHVIKGTVYAPGDVPANRVEVVLESSSGLPIARTYTDPDGRYVFTGLGLGTYRVVAIPSAKELASVSQSVEIVTRHPAISVVTVDLHLPAKGDRKSSHPPRALTTFAQEVPPAAEKEYEEAVKKLENGKTEAGVQKLRRAIELFPQYFLALGRLGLLYASQGAYEEAVPLLRRACQVNPRSVASHITLGLSLVELGQYEEATAVLETARSLDRTSVQAHLYLGIAQLQAGELEGAEQALKKAYALGGAEQAAIAHLYLASLYDRQGKYSAAADELETYLHEVPTATTATKIRQVIERLRRKNKG